MSVSNETSRTVLARHRVAEIASRKAMPARAGFEEWLDRQRSDDGRLICKIQIVRASDETKSNFEANWSVSTAGRGDAPDVMAARELGAEIVLPEAEELREKHDVYAVRLTDLPGGGTRKALVAYAFTIGCTLFLYVMNSATKSVLDHSARPEDRGNPFTETLRSAVHRLSFRGWDEEGPDWRVRVDVPGQTRLVRDAGHGKSAWRTLHWANVDLVVDGKHIDVRRNDEEFVFDILSGVSAKDLVETVTRLYRHQQAILMAGKWYLSASLLPFTHGPTLIDRHDGKQDWTEEDPHTLRALEESGDRLRRLVDRALETAASDPGGSVDWKAVASFAGRELGIETRAPKQQRRGGLAIHKANDGGYGAIRRLLAPNYLAGWRTGQILTHVKVPDKVEDRAVLFDGDIEVVQGTDGAHRYAIPVDFPQPRIECDKGTSCNIDWHTSTDGHHKTHGWPVSDAKLQRLERLRTKKHPAGPRAGGPTRRRPLVGITGQGFIVDGRQFRIAPTGTSIYQVHSRPAPDDAGKSWDQSDVRHEWSFRAADAHKEVGRALKRALHEVEAQVKPLRASARTRPQDDSADDLRRQLDTAKKRLDEAQLAVDGASLTLVREEARVERDGDVADQEAVQDARRTERLAKEERTQSRAEVERLQRCIDEQAPPVRPTTATIGTVPPAVFATALTKIDDYADRHWNDLAKTHVPAESVQVTPIDRGARLRLQLEFRIQSTEEDGWLNLPISVELKNVIQKNQDGELKRPQLAAELYLRDGHSFASVAERMGTQSIKQEKNSYLWHLLHEALADHVPVSSLRTAIIDTPPALTPLRSVIWHLVSGDREGIDGLPSNYVERILETYTQLEADLPHSWGWHWVGTTHVHEREILRAMRSPEDGISLSGAVAAAGTTRGRVLATARRPRSGRPRPSPISNIPPRLHRTWARTDRLDDDSRILKPIACPHPDCPDRRNGGSAWASHPLWVPETWTDAVLCPGCLRTPSDPDVVFPPQYLKAWRGPVGPESKRRGIRDAGVTHLAPKPDAHSW